MLYSLMSHFLIVTKLSEVDRKSFLAVAVAVEMFTVKVNP